MPLENYSLAYVQQYWVQDFVSADPKALGTSAEEEELLIALLNTLAITLIEWPWATVPSSGSHVLRHPCVSSISLGWQDLAEQGLKCCTWS